MDPEYEGLFPIPFCGCFEFLFLVLHWKVLCSLSLSARSLGTPPLHPRLVPTPTSVTGNQGYCQARNWEPPFSSAAPSECIYVLFPLLLPTLSRRKFIRGEEIINSTDNSQWLILRHRLIVAVKYEAPAEGERGGGSWGSTEWRRVPKEG